MITLPLTTYAFLVAVSAALFILVIYFIVLNFLNSKRVGKTEDEMKKLKRETEKRQEEILERARYDYEAIITHATEKAEEIINGANTIHDRSSGVLDSDYDKLLTEQRLKLAESSEELKRKYEDQIDQINKQNVQLLQSAYKDIIEYSAATLGIFKQDLEKETFESKKLADEKIQAEYEKLDAELEQKKKEAIERINQNISKVLLFVSKEAFGKNIKVEDQQQLILQSLDRAKKELLV